MKLGKSQRDKDGVQVSSVAARRSDGYVLMGLRGDSNKWCLPGGHLEPGERAERGAVRELLEETGLRARSLTKLGSGKVKGGSVEVHSFECQVDGNPTSDMDPDGEFVEFRWVDPEDIPQEILANLYNKPDVTLQLLGSIAKAGALDKSMKGAVAGAAIGLASLVSPEQAKASQPAPSQMVEVTNPKPWSSAGLHPELKGIAVLESSSGVNMHHAKHHLGPFHTAYGAVGLKPVTAYEAYQRTPSLKSAHPNLDDPQKFLSQFQGDWNFYNQAASAHWSHIRKLFPDQGKAAYAWRWGIGAAGKASKEEIESDPYVQKYLGMQKPVAKSEEDDERVSSYIYPYLSDDLRRKPYSGHENPLAGHCYVASEALYHMLGGAKSGYVPQNINHEGSSYWYLKNRETGKILDPTAGQFETPVPYHLGVGRGFLTVNPSARAQTLIDRIQKNRLSRRAVWKSKDGISIPVSGTPERHAWDERFRQALVGIYSPGGPHNLKPRKIDPADPSVSGVNNATNLDRLDLYRRMARAGDPLPPIVVRRSGRGWMIVDGNHRHQAALEQKLPSIDAYEIATPTKKAAVRKSEDLDPIVKAETTTVYRLEDKDGRGPYVSHDEGSPHGMFAEARALGYNVSGKRSHHEDFDKHTVKRAQNQGYVSGFMSEDGARAWFGDNPKVWDVYKKYGFRLVPVQATHVFVGNSGDQVLFRPHPSEVDKKVAYQKLVKSEQTSAAQSAEISKNEEKKLVLDPTPEEKESFRTAFDRMIPPDGSAPRTKLDVDLSPHMWGPDEIYRAMTNPYISRNEIYTIHSRFRDTDGWNRLDRQQLRNLLEDHGELTVVANDVLSHPNLSAEDIGSNAARVRYTSKIDSLPRDNKVALAIHSPYMEPLRQGLSFTREELKRAMSHFTTHQRSTMIRDFARNDQIATKDLVYAIGDTEPYAPTALYHVATVRKDIPKETLGLIIDRCVHLGDTNTLLRQHSIDLNTVNDLAQRISPEEFNFSSFIGSLSENKSVTKDMISDFIRTNWNTIERYGWQASQDMVNSINNYGSHIDTDVIRALPGGTSLIAQSDLQGDKSADQCLATKEDISNLLQSGNRGDVSVAYHHPLLDPEFAKKSAYTEKNPEFARLALNTVLKRHPGSLEDNEMYINHAIKGGYSKSRDPLDSVSMFIDMCRDSLETNDPQNRPDHKKINSMVVEAFSRAMHPDTLQSEHYRSFPPSHLGREAADLFYAMRGHVRQHGETLSDEQLRGLRDTLEAARSIVDADTGQPILRSNNDGRKPNDGEELDDALKKAISSRDPDSAYTEKVGVKLGLGKLRAIRDRILAISDSGEVKPKDLPPGDWSVGRLPNGNISAQKIQQHIDSQPTTHTYNISHDTWEGSQRSDPSKPNDVFQVSCTTDQINKLRQVGALGTFHKMWDGSYVKGHCASPFLGLGWVRHTHTDNPKSYFIEEVQSDLASSLRSELYPEENRKAIKKILFGDRHPNEVLHEAFLQHLRDKGHADADVHIHSVESKAPISLGESISHRTEAPAHFNTTYHDVPQKLGYKPAKFGDLPPSETVVPKEAPLWSNKVRKFEYELELYLGETLQKNRPGPVFPRLGITDRTQPKVVNTQKEHQTMSRAMAVHSFLPGGAHHALIPRLTGTPTTTPKGNPRKRSAIEREAKNLWDKDIGRARTHSIDSLYVNNLDERFYGAVMTNPGSKLGYVAGSEMRKRRGSLMNDPRSVNATGLHESLHLTFAAVAGKYKNDKECRTNLVQNLHDHIRKVTPAGFSAMSEFLRYKYGVGTGNAHYPEEMLTCALNYLNNPNERKRFHAMNGHDETESRSFSNNMKSGYRAMIQGANQADEDWLLSPAGKRLADLQKAGLARKAKNLELFNLDKLRRRQDGVKKSETNLDGGDLEEAAPVAVDMIGFNPETHPAFAAARFLAGGRKAASYQEIRQALYDNDSDYVAAAIQVYDLPPTKESYSAVQAVEQLGSLSKSDTGQKLPKGDDIVAGTPSAEASAEAVKRAFANDQVSLAHLDGKHSQGSLIARDEESQVVFLLKPGAGGKSPAKGAAEDPATPSCKESAFWHIMDAVGLGENSPRTELVLIDGKQYAAIQMLPFSYKNMQRKLLKHPAQVVASLEPYRNTGILTKWAIIDMVLGNPDRHGQNIMISEDNKNCSLIDHGSAFAGVHFDPAHDRNSFIPWYLRAWAPRQFGKLSEETKLKYLPQVSGVVRNELSQWLESVNPDRLEGIMLRYGIDPRPTLARLAKLKTLAAKMPVDVAINTMWVSV